MFLHIIMHDAVCYSYSSIILVKSELNRRLHAVRESSCTALLIIDISICYS